MRDNRTFGATCFGALVVVFVLGSTNITTATTILSVAPGGTGLINGVSPVGGLAGQNFIAPAESRLDSWTFWLGNTSGSNTSFVFHVDAFVDTGSAGGPNYPYASLYSSPVETMAPFEGSNGTGTPKTWSNLDLSLQPGASYLAYLSWVSGPGPVSFGNQGGNPYPGGWSVVYNPNNGYWFGNPAYDDAFTAVFNPVPEPATLPILLSGIMMLRRTRSRKR